MHSTTGDAVAEVGCEETSSTRIVDDYHGHVDLIAFLWVHAFERLHERTRTTRLLRRAWDFNLDVGHLDMFQMTELVW